MEDEDKMRRRPKRPDEFDDENEIMSSIRRPVFGRDPFFGTDIDAEFERMRKLMDRMMSEAMNGETMKDQNKPFIYGFSMRTGPDGKPVFQEFGNTRNVRRLNGDHRASPGQKSSQAQRAGIRGREPLTDIIDCGDTLAVTVELPGVEKKDIHLEVQDDQLLIKVNTESRRYFKEVDLPSAVEEGSVKASYMNGVLDVTLKKKSHEKRKGKKVKIE